MNIWKRSGYLAPLGVFDVCPCGSHAMAKTVESGSSPFTTLPTQVNPANAAAAAADAQRYARVAGDAVIGTHGSSAQAVTEYDPGASSGDPAFVTTLVGLGATAPIAHQRYIPYADNGDVIGN